MNMASVTIRPVDSARYVEIKDLYKHNLASLNNYIEELQWWNKRVNLVSRDVSRETLVKHVEHSLLLLLVPIVNEAANILDVGTGGGLPGMPLAICRADHSVQRIVMNDKVEKKIWAVKQMIKKLGISGVDAIAKNASTITHRDIGSVSRGTTGESSVSVCITKHAFKVDQLLDLISPEFVNEFVFLKGRAEAIEEIKRVKEPVSAVIYSLDEIDETAFYQGKAIVHLSR
jgi:16S rRNA (guanine527-N7)-methyltransferase